MKKNTWIIVTGLIFSLLSTTAYSADNEASVEDRLKRLERMVNSKGLVDIMVRVESMQGELQRLLGEIELQKHSLEEIKKRIQSDVNSVNNINLANILQTNLILKVKISFFHFLPLWWKKGVSSRTVYSGIFHLLEETASPVSYR